MLFLLGSALCGAAQTMTQLIVFRGLQGIGAGTLMPVAIAFRLDEKDWYALIDSACLSFLGR